MRRRRSKCRGIRTIKPDFFASDDVAELPIRARLTWIGPGPRQTTMGDGRTTLDLSKRLSGLFDDVYH